MNVTDPAIKETDSGVTMGSVKIVTASELVEPLGSRMPPVSEGQNKEAAPPEEKRFDGNRVGVLMDAKGNVFDGARHAANADGSPKTNKHGLFYPKGLGKGKHGTKPGASNAVEGGGSQIENAPTPQIVDRPPPVFADDPNFGKASSVVSDEYDLMAEVYLQSVYGPLILALSEEIRPEGTEHAALKQSLAAWLRHKQAKELSPGWAFGVTAIGVFVAKTGKPTVRQRIALWSLKIKSWFKKEKS